MTDLVPLPSAGGFRTHERAGLPADFAGWAMSPEIAYSLACHLVRAETTDRGQSGVLPDAPPSDARIARGERLRSLLSIAFLNDELRRWAMIDPELARIRDVPGAPREVTAEFRRIAGITDAAKTHPVVPGRRAAACKVDPLAATVFARACDVDPLDGFAAAASNALAALAKDNGVVSNPITVDDLKKLRGALSWASVEREVWQALQQDYAYTGDPARVKVWLARIMGAEAPDPALAPNTPPVKDSPAEGGPKDGAAKRAEHAVGTTDTAVTDTQATGTATQS